MKFTTFYFTGTGNTWWVAKEFTKIAKEAGHKAEYYSIEKKSNLDESFIRKLINESDAIGIAYPIYASTLPQIMWDYLDILCKINLKSQNEIKKIGYTLTTMALFSGDGALVPRRKMKKAGLKLMGAINICMASNLAVPYFRYNPVGEKKLKRRKKWGKKKLRKLVLKLSSNKKYMEGRNPFLIFVGWLQRIFAKREIRLIAKYWSVDLERCTRCLKCVSDCPTESISYNKEKDIFTFKNTCTACMRCYNMCPTNSIKMFNKFANPKKYKRYHGPPGEGFKVNLVHD